MPLAKKEYKSYDALILALKASPVCTILKFLLSVTQSIMQTAVMAVATANFVDTAAEILNNVRPQSDIYLPLVLLLAALGVVNTIGAVAKLAGARVSVKLQRKLKPSLIKVYAAFEYKHIENAESWELISRVTRDLFCCCNLFLQRAARALKRVDFPTLGLPTTATIGFLVVSLIYFFHPFF